MILSATFRSLTVKNMDARILLEQSTKGEFLLLPFTNTIRINPGAHDLATAVSDSDQLPELFRKRSKRVWTKLKSPTTRE